MKKENLIFQIIKGIFMTVCLYTYIFGIFALMNAIAYNSYRINLHEVFNLPFLPTIFIISLFAVPYWFYQQGIEVGKKEAEKEE